MTEHDPHTHPQQELAVLRARYRRELPGKVRAVCEGAAALADAWDPARLEALHLLVHRLVGSAAIYGFGEVSHAAALLEAEVAAAMEAPAAPPPQVRAQFEALVEPLARAVAETARPVRPPQRTRPRPR